MTWLFPPKRLVSLKAGLRPGKLSDRFSPSPSLHRKRGEVQTCSVRLHRCGRDNVSSEEATFWFGAPKGLAMHQVLDLVQLQSPPAIQKITRFDPWGHARTQLGFVVQLNQHKEIRLHLA